VAAPLSPQIAERIARFPGQISLAASDLDHDWHLAFRADNTVPSASVIKLLILAELYRQASRGALSLEAQVSIEQEHVVEGSGVLRWLSFGLRFTVRDLATLMIIVSDNIASNRLIDILGFAAINHLASQLGLQQTALRRPFWGRAARADEPENTMSASDAVALLRALECGMIVPEGPLLDEVRTILRAQQFQECIPACLPPAVVVGNKTGSLPGIAHDAAILWAPQGRLALAIFTTGLTDEHRGRCEISEIARACYNAWIAELYGEENERGR
jgi:beta-lactamase class A